MRTPAPPPMLLPIALLAIGALGGCAVPEWMRLEQPIDNAELARECKQACETGDYSQADRMLASAVRRDPENVDYALRLADLALSRGDTEAAVGHYERLLTRVPALPSAWETLGDLHLARGNETAASDAYQNALRYAPHDIGVMLKLGERLTAAGSDADAVENYHRLLTVDPDHSTARLRLAALHLKSKQPRRAPPLLREVITLTATDAADRSQAHWLLGVAYGRLDRWPAASEALHASLTGGAARTAEEWYAVAYADFRADRPNEAEAATRKALAHDRRHAGATTLLLALTGGFDPTTAVRTASVTQGHSQAWRRSQIVVPEVWK